MGVTFASLILALILAVSGGLKVRAGSRLGIGLTPATLAELAVAAALAFLPLVASTLPPWIAAVALTILIGSSVHHAIRLSRIRRRREASVDGRLAAYLTALGDEKPDAEA